MSESINVKLHLPTFLSRSNKYDKENSELKMFFDVENGSIAVSQAKCTTHHINIALSAKHKRFTKTFLDALIVLQLAADVLAIIVDIYAYLYIYIYIYFYDRKTCILSIVNTSSTIVIETKT